MTIGSLVLMAHFQRHASRKAATSITESIAEFVDVVGTCDDHQIAEFINTHMS